MSTIKEKVKKVFETVQVSDKYSKRELIVTTDGQYPQDISVQFGQDKCSLLDGIKEGQEVEVSYNLKGREWTNPQGEVKYFNTIEGWKVQTVGQVAQQPVQSTEPPF